MRLFPPYTRLRKSAPVVIHNGVFQKQVSFIEGTALIISGTIGAGVLGIPFAIAHIGLGLGVIYIILIGLLMMGLNLLLGEITAKTREPLQLAGLARKYLGPVGGMVMTVMLYAMLFGVLTVYIIGEGETLAAIFGGSSFEWSLIFFAFASLLVAIGLRTVKVVEVFLLFGALSLVFLLTMVSLPHVSFPSVPTPSMASLFLPYGILLFAFHGTTAIPEAHSVLVDRDHTFRRAIIISSAVCTLVYLLFAGVVVGVTGTGTTEIATIGLGQALGPGLFLIGNLFAVLAMGTSFLIGGVALRNSLQWDFHLPTIPAILIVALVPLAAFLFGTREFIATIDIVGGVFVSLEMLMILAIYWQAKRQGHLPEGKYAVHHASYLLLILLLALSAGAVYSVYNLF